MAEPAIQQIVLHATRLVRLLSELAVTDIEFSHRNFSQRLGGLIDFSEAMRLSSLHAQLGRIDFEPSAAAVSYKDELLRARMALMQSLVASFVPGSGSRIRLPAPSPTMSIQTLATFEPYHRFYAAHQREFESRIQILQLGVRDGIRGESAELAQLAALDEGVRDALSIHIRKHLAVIPQLLGKHFAGLAQANFHAQAEAAPEASGERSEHEIFATWVCPSSWLGGFFNDMQGLLLAELELRLLPVVGLVEAADEQVEKR